MTLTLSAQGDVLATFDLDELICKEQARAMTQMEMNTHRNERADETDIIYQEIHWEINPAVYYIKGVISYQFKSKKDQLTQVVLDLANTHQVNFVRRGNQDLNFTHTSDQLLTIDLGKTLNAGVLDSFTISYEGMPPSNGFGSFEQNTHAKAPVIWTLSEPYGARDWWPAKQDLIDKVDSMDVFLTTPFGNLGASNGKLMSIDTVDGKLVHHWRHRHPIASYLIALAVTNYASYSHYVPLTNGDSIEILNYVYPENLETAKLQTISAVDIMSFYNEKFVVYPFADEKYGHAQFGWGGGMEHQTMSFMYNFGFGLIAHEMAHQWFGDKVTCGSWAEIWLNEGFATYLSGLTLEEFSPTEYWPQWKNSTLNSATSQPGGSVYVDDTTSVNRIFSNRLTYNKGAYVLHMLRWVNGDDAFFQGCRNYLNGAGTSYDFGTTRELQHQLEAVSGKDLNEFIDDWYYGEGYPSYNIKWAQQADSLIVVINQTQSHPSVSYFEMPVPVFAYHGGNGERFVFQNTDQDQRFSAYVGNVHVDSLQCDPEKWILSRNNTVSPLITSVDGDLQESTFAFSPNPADQYIQFATDLTNYEIALVDAQGRQLKARRDGQRIELNELAPGFYTVLITNAKSDIVSRQPLVIYR